MADTEVIRNLPVGHGDGSWIMRAAGVSQPYICTMSFNFTAPPTSTQMEDIQAKWGTYIMPKVGGNITLENFHVFFKVDATNDQVFDANGTPVLGGGGAAASVATAQVAVLARKKTQFAGRRNVGRMYIPGVLESAADANGVLTAGEITAWNTALADLYAGLAQYNPEIVHSKVWDTINEPTPPTPPLPTPITSLTVDNVVATQRRRLHRT